MLAALLCGVGALLTPCGATGQTSAEIMRRMSALNPKLRAYTARVHVNVALRTFPYISPSLDGKYYHKEPNKDALIFATVPALAKQFNKVYPRIESASRWNRVYFVSLASNSDATAVFKLVPRVHGRIDHIDAKVDLLTATVLQMTWYYNDGGYAELNQQYTQIHGNYVPSHQTGHVELPAYKADVDSSFSNFILNPKISDSVFKQ